MGDVQELRLVLTVSDFEAAVTLYRDALGLPELEDWSDGDAQIVLLDGGRATLELVNERQAAAIDHTSRSGGVCRARCASRSKWRTVRRRPSDSLAGVPNE